MVDDEPDILNVLTEALQALGGCDVRAARDAKSALLMLDSEHEPFDGIFVDIQMPDTTGIELCGIIRATPGYGDVPIIMLTAMTERSYLQDAFAKGANDYITKPFDFSELEKKLAKHRANSFRRKQFKDKPAYGAKGAGSPDREVIRSLEDAVTIRGVERCVGREAFQTYILQTQERFDAPVYVRAIKVAQVYELFSGLAPGEYQAAIQRIAEMLSDVTKRSHDVFAHFGNGIFLSSSVGKSSLDEASLSDGLERDARFRKLAENGAALHLILGKAVAVSGASKADGILSLRTAIESAESMEESMSSWGTFREWMLQKMSIGRERSRMDKAAYEQLLEDFIDAGELGWK